MLKNKVVLSYLIETNIDLFCNLLNISKIAGPNGFYYSEKLGKCFGVLLLFPRPPLEARSMATRFFLQKLEDW